MFSFYLQSANMQVTIVFGFLIFGIIHKTLSAEVPPTLEDALHPMTFTSVRYDDHISVSIRYSMDIDVTAYWIYSKSTDSGLAPSVTKGHLDIFTKASGTYAVSSIEIDTVPDGQFSTAQLAFVLATDIGELVVDIYRPASLDNHSEDVTKTGIKINIPETVETSVNPDAIGNQENLTIVIEYSPNGNDKMNIDLQVRSTYDFSTGPELRNVSNFELIGESDTDFGVRKSLSIPRHHIKHTEEFTFAMEYTGTVIGPLFVTVSLYHRGLVQSYEGHKSSPVIFINSTRLFAEAAYFYYRGATDYSLTSDRIILEDGDKYRTISCAAYGYPKPKVIIRNSAGNIVPSVDLQRGSSLTTHVMAELDTLVPLQDVVGSYTCEAFNENSRATRTIYVERIVPPVVKHFGVIRKDGVKIVVECEVTGQPLPEFTFNVNTKFQGSIQSFFNRRDVRGRYSIKQHVTTDGKTSIGILTLEDPNTVIKNLTCEASFYLWRPVYSETISLYD